MTTSMMAAWLFVLVSHAGVAEPLPELECLVEPNIVVDVGSPEHGVVESIAVDRSDTVSADDVLAKLESSEQAANVRKARARASMAAEINARKATLELAQRKQQRMRDLFASDAISTQQRDEVETELKMAQMQLQQARDAGSLARIELDRAVGDLDRRTIRSPISGVIVERFVAPGEYVNEKPLLRVAQLNPLRVETVAPSTLFGKIKTGMRARVVSDTLGGQVFDAEVTIVDRMIDPASGTFGVRLELPNPDYAIPSGVNCRLQIDSSPPKTAAVAPVESSAPTAAVASRLPQNDAQSVAATPVLAVGQADHECRSLGPFDDGQQLDKLIAALSGDLREIERRERREEKVTGYVVMTRPLPTVDNASMLAASIAKQGVRDLAVMRSGPNRGRISFGVFNNKHNAVVRQKQIRELDVDVEIVPQNAASMQVWADFELSAAAIERAPWKKMMPGLVTADCPPSSHVMADAAQSSEEPL